MTIEKTQSIKDLEKTITKGEFDIAFDQIDEFLKSNETTTIEKIQAKIWNCMLLFWVGRAESNREKLSEASRIISDVLSECEELGETELIFDALVWYNWYLWVFSKTREFVEGVNRQEKIYQKLEEEGCLALREKNANLLVLKGNVGIAKAVYDNDYKWNNQESIDFLKEGVEEAEGTDNKILQIICSHQLVTMYNIVANYDKSIEVLDKIIEIIDELENDYFKSVMLTETGFVYFRKGEYEKLLDYTKKSLEVKERIGNERLIAQSYGYLGAYHGITGNTKEALEYTIKAHKILTENGKKSDNSTWLNNLAIFLYDLGELDKAIDHMERLYEILKKDKRELASMYVLANVASFYIQKGELDKALELESQCLDFFERIGDKNQIYWDLYTISTIYEKKGLVNKALEYLERAQKIILQIGNKTLIAGLFYRFVTLASKYNKLELAKEYYKKLEEIVEDIEYKNIKRLILIAEGIILKNSKDSRERDRAEVLFDHLLQEELEISLTIEVLLQLSELLLTELKETSNERYLTKLQKNVSKLVEIGTEANLPEVIIESLWFKSQLSLLMMDIDKARELLTQALDIAERKGYNKLALKITKAKEQLIKQKMELDELEKEAPTISKRMEVVKVENGFKELKQKEIFEYNIEKIDPSKKLFSIKI